MRGKKCDSTRCRRGSFCSTFFAAIIFIPLVLAFDFAFVSFPFPFPFPSPPSSPPPRPFSFFFVFVPPGAFSTSKSSPGNAHPGPGLLAEILPLFVVDFVWSDVHKCLWIDALFRW